jgi:HEAT repeat protein
MLTRLAALVAALALMAYAPRHAPAQDEGDGDTAVEEGTDEGGAWEEGEGTAEEHGEEPSVEESPGEGAGEAEIEEPSPAEAGETETGGGSGEPFTVDEEQVRTLFREGVRQFEAGRTKEAYVAFERALALKPSSDLLRFLRDETGNRVLIEMFGNKDLKDTAVRIVELSRGAYRTVPRTEEQIRALVDGLGSEEFDRTWKSINALVSVGQRAVPFLLEHLRDDSHPNLSAHCIITLTKMAGEAVLPVAEAMESTVPRLRQNAAIVLGNIRDHRALGALKRAWEDPDELPEVKTFVAESLRKITGRDPENLPTAKEYFYTLADRYYTSHPSVLPDLFGEFLVWRWDAKEDRLAPPREVPGFAYNEEIAEEACYDAIALDDRYDAAWVLLALNYFQETVEGDAAIELAQKKRDAGEMPPAVADRLREGLAGIGKAGLVGSVAGRRNLYRALKRCLDDNNVPVAVAVLETLARVGDPEDLPLPPLSPSDERILSAEALAEYERERATKIAYPIVEALIHKDKRIRYQAAVTLVALQPDRRFLGIERVATNLADAVGESGIRVVLVADGDNAWRNSLRAALRRMNCMTVDVSTPAEALLRAKEFPPKDLIIMDGQMAGTVLFTANLTDNRQVSETVFDSLKEDLRTRAVPILISGGPDRIENFKDVFGPRCAGFVAKPLDKMALKAEIEKAFDTDQARRDAKSLADRLAQKAAEALASIKPATTYFTYRDAVSALIGTLKDRPDAVRVPAIRALGNFGDTRALEPLARTLQDAENSTEVRAACGRAMGEIFRDSHAAPPDEVFPVLLAALRDPEFSVQEAAAAALANARLSAGQQREVAEANRIHR